MSQSRHTQILLWGVSILAALALGLAARGAGPLPGDVAASRMVQRWVYPDGVAGSMMLGLDEAVWFMPVLVAIAYGALRRWREAAFVLLACVLALVVAEGVLPGIIARPRPTPEVIPVYDPGDGFGFPSGSALVSFVLFALVCYLTAAEARNEGARPPLGVVVASVVVVCVVGIARIFSGAHWTSDVVGGWLWGMVVAQACVWLFERIARARRDA